MTTYWIARNDVYSGDRRLRVFGAAPFFLGNAWHAPLHIKPHTQGAPCRQGAIGGSFYDALGLPREPAPGECWKVKWVKRQVLKHPYDLVGADMRLVPIARDVTAELKEAKS